MIFRRRETETRKTARSNKESEKPSSARATALPLRYLCKTFRNQSIAWVPPASLLDTNWNKNNGDQFNKKPYQIDPERPMESKSKRKEEEMKRRIGSAASRKIKGLWNLGPLSKDGFSDIDKSVHVPFASPILFGTSTVHQVINPATVILLCCTKFRSLFGTKSIIGTWIFFRTPSRALACHR